MSDHSNDFAEQIDRMAAGFRDAQILLTANRLELFSLLETTPRASVPEMARVLGASERGLQILCDALVALRLLRKTNDRYENSEAARYCLLPSSPAPKGAILLHTAKLYERWGKLYDAVLSGQPVPDEQIDPRLRFDEAGFARAMADSARAMVKVTAEALPLAGVARVLDVGGGPGLYSIEFSRRNSGRRCVIMDNPPTRKIALENIREAGLEDRVTPLPGDILRDDPGGPYDLVFVSNLIHSFSADDNARLVKKCAGVLNSGGAICLKDFFLEADRTSPVWAALFAVNMLVSTESGSCYTVEEASGWLDAAGLTRAPFRMITPQTGLLIGRKSD